MTEQKCEAGCKAFTGGEIKHHPDCCFYPASFTKMYDDLKKEHETLKNNILKILIEINLEILKNIGKPNIGKKGCAKRLQQLLDGGNYTEDVEYGDKI